MKRRFFMMAVLSLMFVTSGFVDLHSNVSLVLPSTSRHISILLEETASSSLPVVSHSAILKSPN